MNLYSLLLEVWREQSIYILRLSILPVEKYVEGVLLKSAKHKGERKKRKSMAVEVIPALSYEGFLRAVLKNDPKVQYYVNQSNPPPGIAAFSTRMMQLKNYIKEKKYQKN